MKMSADKSEGCSAAEPCSWNCGIYEFFFILPGTLRSCLFVDRDIHLITSILYGRKMYRPSRPQNTQQRFQFSLPEITRGNEKQVWEGFPERCQVFVLIRLCMACCCLPALPLTHSEVRLLKSGKYTQINFFQTPPLHCLPTEHLAGSGRSRTKSLQQEIQFLPG